MELWLPQQTGIFGVYDAIDAGFKRILLVSPTGGGKTRMAQEIAKTFLERRQRVVMYSNRKMLVRQTSRVMAAAGHDHGVRAAGYKDERELDFQISSIQTESSRVLRKRTWELHDAALVIVDEAHLQKSRVARRILNAHRKAGAIILGLTATPIDLGDLYDAMVIAGVTSELRECGALVMAHHFGPDEPQLKKTTPLGKDLTEKQIVDAIMREGIFGRVIQNFLEINPAQTPTMLFAPGVAQSVWFAEQFSCPEKREEKYRGLPAIRAAHIDGDEIWIDGQFMPSNAGARDMVMEGSKDGSIKVICNRFVLREGIDAPWIEHLILATVMGSLQTYLQTVDRGLRASRTTGKTCLTIQDHGGNWHRHGSANADREWSLELTTGIAAGLRQERLRSKKCRRCKTPLKPLCPRCFKCGFNNEVEPRVCPQCKRIVVGSKCACGFDLDPKVKFRPVIQSDGVLKQLGGDIYRPHRISTSPRGPAIWERMYWRSRTDKGERTFRAALTLFAQENKWFYPDPSWPYMPIEEWDYFRLVKEVPMERLTPKPG